MNRRKKSSGGGGKLVIALLVVALLGAAAYLLWGDYRHRPVPPATVETGPESLPMPHQKLPERIPVMPNRSAASRPAAPLPAPAPAPAPAARHAKGPGRVAIIIDDMGTSLQELQALTAIGQPLTFSVIPGLAHAKGVAESAHRAGYEVMVHMPMEPEGYPKQRMEKIGLLVSMEAPEIVARVNGYFASVPFAVGANNHMGSRFTQDAEKMEVVLKVLKGRGMFFVDSRTSPASVGYETARALGMRCAARQVFLDNVQDEGAIGRQLAQVAAAARRGGQAIAICHPHPATIRALQAAMPELVKSGITFVRASALTS